MQHCTPEQLALAALGEPLPADDAAHLEACAECRAEVASLRRGVELLAVPEFAAPGAPVPPPPAVWASIAAATGVAAAPRPERVAAEPAPVPEPTAPPTNVVPLRPRRPRPWLLVAAAAVVGAAVGAGAVAVLQGNDDDGAAVAAAALDPLENADASGSARVVERADGTRVLEVDLRAPELDGAYYEVWLLEPDVSRPRAAGHHPGRAPRCSRSPRASTSTSSRWSTSPSSRSTATRRTPGTPSSAGCWRADDLA